MEKNVINSLAVMLSIVASLAIIISVTDKPTVVVAEAVETKPKIENKVFFDKIFMHQVDKYSIFTVGDDNKVVIRSYYSYQYDNINLICDVPKGERMWTEEWKNGNWERGLDVNIHIHMLDDLNGAGWNNGKHGSGTTSKIE